MKRFLYSFGLLVCFVLIFIWYEITCRVMSGTDDVAIWLTLFGWMVLAAGLGGNIYYVVESFIKKE